MTSSQANAVELIGDGMGRIGSDGHGEGYARREETQRQCADMRSEGTAEKGHASRRKGNGLIRGFMRRRSARAGRVRHNHGGLGTTHETGKKV